MNFQIVGRLKAKRILKKRIKQVWVPYWMWEDLINGMWRKLPKEEELEMLTKSIEFTGDWVKYGAAMIEVVKAWPLTMLNNLTNPSMNKRAFLGHCACCYEFGCPEYITRLAWRELTDRQRFDADEIAQMVIDEWHEKTDLSAYQNMGVKVLQ